MNLLEPLRRHALAKKLLFTDVADDVNDDAAQCRSGGGHEHVQKKTGAVCVDIASDHGIDRQANEAAIEGRRGQNAPGAQRLEQGPQDDGIAGKDVLDGFQDLNLEVYVKAIAPCPFGSFGGKKT